MLLDPRNGPAFDLPPSGPTRAWVIASVPRTGSTLLGRQLAATGRVGDPKEYLNPMQVRDWEARLAPRRLTRWRHAALVGPLVPLAGRGPWTDARLDAYLDRVRARRSSGGWFGLKIHHHHLQRWFLDRARDPVAALGAERWVLLTRQDRVAQAVSWARALGTGAWASWQRERLPPVYDRRLVAGRLAAITAAEEGWEAFFAGRGITPLRLTYEELVEDLDGSVRRVLAFLDVPDAATIPLPPPDLARQADATSAAWVARFLAEQAP